MSDKSRVNGLKSAPISWRERDILTAAERYLNGSIDYAIVDEIGPYFGIEDSNHIRFLDHVWGCVTATFHLSLLSQNESNNTTIKLQKNAARIYHQESQRQLGGIFPLQNEFWKSFYTRQAKEYTKPMVAIDAMYHLGLRKDAIAYQLIQQGFKSILKGYYDNAKGRKASFQNARRLLIDFDFPILQKWLRNTPGFEINLKKKNV